MITAKVTSKCQITIPKEVRKRMGIQPGDQLEFVEKRGYTISRNVSTNLLSISGGDI
ncbi:MAG: AbrB/MazE/SpoVT family DNA-binding domain-containing protein [SAR202 cluster bacterium]|nr:AbrB/MazE/SpoVT family DNA-binding domain-containing protein [SAR202 cluster bacterium]